MQVRCEQNKLVQASYSSSPVLCTCTGAARAILRRSGLDVGVALAQHKHKLLMLNKLCNILLQKEVHKIYQKVVQVVGIFLIRGDLLQP